jgi:hypothetical protein
MSESSNSNGHTQWDDVEVGKTAYQRLTMVGDKKERYSNSHTNGEGPEIRKAGENEEPPHNVKRHPEDPPGAYQGAATEIADPERIRSYADQFGKASQAIDPEWFEWLVRPLYRCVHGVRIGALVIPGRREAGEQMKVAASTGAAIARIQEEGEADGKKAGRLESDVIPRVNGELTKADGKLEEAEHEVEVAREDVGRVRAEEDEQQTRRANAPRLSQWREWLREARTNLFSRTRFSPKKAGIVFGVEVIGSSILLAPNIADVIDTSIELGYAIAAVISIATLAAAFGAGLGLAAIRLPGWLVGFSVVAAFGAILVKFVPALDALRQTDDAGVETMTAATLATFLIAMVSGYALAVADDRREARESEEEGAALRKKAGSPLGDALQILAEKQEKRTEAKQDRDRLDQLRSALWDKVESLRDSASRAGAASEQRRQEGIEAEVEAETIRAVAEAGIEQEEEAAEWAYLIALAAQEKARVEVLPKVPDVPDRAARPGVEAVVVRERGKLSPLQLLALGVAAASGIASLFLGLIPLGVGIPLAALLVLLDRGFGGRSGEQGQGADGLPPTDHRRRIVAPADGENPLYVYQPDRMVPKYGDGGAGAGERQ